MEVTTVCPKNPATLPCLLYHSQRAAENGHRQSYPLIAQKTVFSIDTSELSRGPARVASWVGATGSRQGHSWGRWDSVWDPVGGVAGRVAAPEGALWVAISLPVPLARLLGSFLCFLDKAGFHFCEQPACRICGLSAPKPRVACFGWGNGDDVGPR